ncbi:MAG: hypothetical protein R3C03_13520 [Pirellulaceae bacterium]
MNWKILLVVLPLFFIGCSKPGSNGANTSASASGSPAGKAELKKLTDAYLESLAARDWEKLSSLHWSGGEFTADYMEQNFGPMLDKTKGTMSKVELYELKEYDKDTYSDYLDDEEVPGDIENLRGEVEFAVRSDDASDKEFYCWILLCEEDGMWKVLKYIEAFRE